MIRTQKSREDRYRKMAAEARSLADAAGDRQAAAAYIALGARWSRLADGGRLSPPVEAPLWSIQASGGRSMEDACGHVAGVQDVVPSALGCEECLKSGSEWLHLRLCRTCGHVGCCDQSPNRHATAHFHATKHPIIEGYDPPEGWGWCYVDEVFFDFEERRTPQRGPIPRFY